MTQGNPTKIPTRMYSGLKGKVTGVKVTDGSGSGSDSPPAVAPASESPPPPAPASVPFGLKELEVSALLPHSLGMMQGKGHDEALVLPPVWSRRAPWRKGIVDDVGIGSLLNAAIDAAASAMQSTARCTLVRLAVPAKDKDGIGRARVFWRAAIRASRLRQSSRASSRSTLPLTSAKRASSSIVRLGLDSGDIRLVIGSAVVELCLRAACVRTSALGGVLKKKL